MKAPFALNQKYIELEERGRKLAEERRKLDTEVDAFMAAVPCELCGKPPVKKLWSSRLLGENAPHICEYCFEAWYEWGKTVPSEVVSCSLELRAAGVMTVGHDLSDLGRIHE